MLEDSLFASRPSARSKKPATLVLSVFVHGALAGALILIPLFQNQLLPNIAVFAPLHPPAAARGVELVPVPNRNSGAPAATTSAPQLSPMTAPIANPTDIARVVDLPASSGPIGAPDRGAGGPGFPNGIVGGDPFPTSDKAAAPPLPPPTPPSPPPAPATPKPTPEPSGPIPRGGNVVQSNLIHTVQPVYPRLAILARVQGAVILEAVITREGLIDKSRLRVLDGHQMLRAAAVEAVEQWRYRPTLLNGKPVEILTTITVNFTMN
jgi:protein TonB